MSFITRDIMKPPNQAHRGDHRANGFLPLAGATGVLCAPNSAHVGGHGAGTSCEGAQVSPVHAPDHRFYVDTLNLTITPCAVEPGHGAIPVEPIIATSKVVHDAVFLKPADA